MQRPFARFLVACVTLLVWGAAGGLSVEARADFVAEAEPESLDQESRASAPLQLRLDSIALLLGRAPADHGYEFAETSDHSAPTTQTQVPSPIGLVPRVAVPPPLLSLPLTLEADQAVAPADGLSIFRPPRFHW